MAKQAKDKTELREDPEQRIDLALEQISAARIALEHDGSPASEYAAIRLDSALEHLSSLRLPGIDPAIREAASSVDRERIEEVEERDAKEAAPEEVAAEPAEDESPSERQPQSPSAFDVDNDPDFVIPEVPLLENEQGEKTSYAARQQRRILQALWVHSIEDGKLDAAPCSLSLEVISGLIERPAGQTSAILSTMKSKGLIFKERQGLFSLAPWVTAYFAERAARPNVNSRPFMREWFVRGEHGLNGYRIPFPKEYPLRFLRKERAEVLAYFSDRGERTIDGEARIRRQDIEKDLGRSLAGTSILLSSLVKEGFLTRVSRGYYALSPYVRQFIQSTSAQ